VVSVSGGVRERRRGAVAEKGEGTVPGLGEDLTVGSRLSARKKKKKKKGREGVIRVGCCGIGVGWTWAGLVRLSATFFFFFSDFLNLLYLLHFSNKSNQTRIENFLKF
jgi:hypothetical protein